MIKIASALTAVTLFVASTGLSFAQDARVAPGVAAPLAPRDLPNGDRSPAPIDRTTGGVGANEVTAPTRTQTRSGGAAGGNGTDSGGGS